MYESIIKKLTNLVYLNAGIEDLNKKLVIEYGINSALSLTITFASLIFIGKLAGLLTEIIAISLSSLILRMATGGNHSKTFLGCYIITLVAFLFLGFAAKQISVFNYSIILIAAIFLISSYIVTKKAPVECENKPISIDRKIYLNKIAKYLCLLIFALQVALIFIGYDNTIIISISIGILWQSLQLTNLSKTIIDKFDYIIVKGG